VLEKINSLPGVLVQYFLLDLSIPDDLFANALKRDRGFYDENVLLQLSETGHRVKEKLKYLTVTYYSIRAENIVDLLFLKALVLYQNLFHLDEVVCEQLRFFLKDGAKIATIENGHSYNDDTYMCRYIEYFV